MLSAAAPHDDADFADSPHKVRSYAHHSSRTRGTQNLYPVRMKDTYVGQL